MLGPSVCGPSYSWVSMCGQEMLRKFPPQTPEITKASSLELCCGLQVLLVGHSHRCSRPCLVSLVDLSIGQGARAWGVAAGPSPPGSTEKITLETRAPPSQLIPPAIQCGPDVSSGMGTAGCAIATTKKHCLVRFHGPDLNYLPPNPKPEIRVPKPWTMLDLCLLTEKPWSEEWTA